MAVHADIFSPQEEWRRPLFWSAAAHVALFGGALLYGALLGGSGQIWGGSGAGGAALNVTLTASIPLQARPAPPENVLAVDSPGQSMTIPRAPERSPEAIPLPAPDARKVEATKAPPPVKKPEPSTRAAAAPPVKVPPQPENVVPYGHGGPAGGALFSSSTGTGGVSVDGGGDFGSRYAWYVDAVRRKVSENWLRYEIDPAIQGAERVYVYFEIGRDGRPSNVRIAQSSGVPSLDRSAVRTLQRIDTFGPLPADYRGSRVSVEFWFDYTR
jgi:protein TonB